ncbi:MAG: AtpZ/AtpI family protein [Chitinivibrionia bacterium]|nr:AtpZ/AtpI family protein [Chitinivibrionia bacterium]
MKNKKEDDRYWMMRQVGLLTTIPLLLAVSPLIGFFMGRFLDRKLHTEPALSIVFLIIGFVAGARQVANVVRKADADYKKKDSDGT